MHDRLGARAHAELVEDARHLVAHGLLALPQLPGDGAVVQAGHAASFSSSTWLRLSGGTKRAPGIIAASLRPSSKGTRASPRECITSVGARMQRSGLAAVRSRRRWPLGQGRDALGEQCHGGLRKHPQQLPLLGSKILRRKVVAAKRADCVPVEHEPRGRMEANMGGPVTSGWFENRASSVVFSAMMMSSCELKNASQKLVDIGDCVCSNPTLAVNQSRSWPSRLTDGDRRIEGSCQKPDDVVANRPGPRVEDEQATKFVEPGRRQTVGEGSRTGHARFAGIWHRFTG